MNAQDTRFGVRGTWSFAGRASSTQGRDDPAGRRQHGRGVRDGHVLANPAAVGQVFHQYVNDTGGKEQFDRSQTSSTGRHGLHRAGGLRRGGRRNREHRRAVARARQLGAHARGGPRLRPAGRLAADRDRNRALLGERGLGGREAGERHAVGRAADVVDAEPVAERDRLRLAAVLAADPELEIGRACCGRARPRAPSGRRRRPGRSSRTGRARARRSRGSARGSGRRRRGRGRARSASGRSCRTRRSRRARRSRRRGRRRAAARSSSRRGSRARPPRPRPARVSSRSRFSSSPKPTSGCMISTSGAAERSRTAIAARTIARTCIS